jgi:hypothetical protein
MNPPVETLIEWISMARISHNEREGIRQDIANSAGELRIAGTGRVLGERDTIRGGEPDAHNVHSGRSFEFTIARLT